MVFFMEELVFKSFSVIIFMELEMGRVLEK